jgi:hypothetical protein
MRTSYRIRTPQVVHETTDGEVLAIDFTTGAYYSMTGPAETIWTAIGDQADLDQIARSVAERYHDDDLTARIEAFLDSLVDEGLLDRREVEGNGSGPPPGRGPEPLGRPSVEKYSDMEEIILLDPVHDVSEAGWPTAPA